MSLYLKGRLLLSRRRGILPALDHFRRAVELDPDYAPAGIAGAYVVCGYFGLLPGSEVRPRTCRRATRSPTRSELADAFAALAVLQQMCENDLDGAGAAFRKALELNPACVQAAGHAAIFFRQAAPGSRKGRLRAREGAGSLVRVPPRSCPRRSSMRAARPKPWRKLARRWRSIRIVRGAVDARQGALPCQSAGRSRNGAGNLPPRCPVGVLSLVTLAKTYAARSARSRRVLRGARAAAGTGVVPAAELMPLTPPATASRHGLREVALDNRDLSFMLLVRHWRDYVELRQDARFAALIRALDAPTPARSIREPQAGPSVIQRRARTVLRRFSFRIAPSSSSVTRLGRRDPGERFESVVAAPPTSASRRISSISVRRRSGASGPVPRMPPNCRPPAVAVVLPVREAIAGIERHAGDSDRRHPDQLRSSKPSRETCWILAPVC